jgi:NAD(P)H-flavin reductase
MEQFERDGLLVYTRTGMPEFKRYFEDAREAKGYRDNILYLVGRRLDSILELHDNIHVVKAHVIAVALIDQNETGSYRG